MKIPMLRFLLRVGVASAFLFSCQSRTSVGSQEELEIPRIEWVNVPVYGEQGELTGNVVGLDPAVAKIAVYIYVNGWWMKPSLEFPLTNIDQNGFWHADITTGGVDEYATEIRAYVVPYDFIPEPVLGLETLPGVLDTIALAEIDTIRRKPPRRIFSFSGYEWWVKSSPYHVGPGPNLFSDSRSNVWVDAEDQLHLQIKKDSDFWKCAEVISSSSFGFGTYRFYTRDGEASFNENVVFGLFTWDDEPDFNHREIDIEFSRWGNPTDLNAQFVVQPWEKPGNVRRFEEPNDSGVSMHQFRWIEDRVEFESRSNVQLGMDGSGTLTAKWVYNGDDVPMPGGEAVRLNLWLLDGKSPSDNNPTSVIVVGFEFLPE